MNIIKGRELAERVKDLVFQSINNNLKNDPLARPNLAIILVGEREDSKLYVSLKEKEAKKLGVDTHLYRFPEEAKEEEILKAIDFLNQDELIDGILVQLPLPQPLDADKIIARLRPEKDVDGFHPEHPDYIIPPLFASILEIAASEKLDWRGKKVCILYNSDVFGASLEDFLKQQGASVTAISAKNFDDLSDEASEALFVKIKSESLEADVLISALGLPKFVKKEMIKPGALVIDIGITKVGEEVLGDVDGNDLESLEGAITPVPGGIGPLTIAFLFKNVLACFLNNKKRG